MTEPTRIPWPIPQRITEPAANGVPTDPTPLGRDLSLLTAHVLLHILEIDRGHAQRGARAATQATGSHHE